MALDGCGLCCKYVLIIFNIIFAVVGFAFLGLGLWLRFSDSTRGIFEIDALSSTTFVVAVTVLIVLGVVMLVVVVFGDYGACNEKRCALQVLSVLLILLAGAEIAVGVLAYHRREEVGQKMVEFYSSLYTLYVTNGDPVLGVTLTFLNKMLHCCGVSGVPLVDLAKETCPKPDGFLEQLVMPTCPGIIANVFDSKAPLVTGIFVGTACLLFIALMCSLILSSKLSRSTAALQYIIMTPPPAMPTNPPLTEGDYYPPHPDNQPVIFTPLTTARITINQA